MMEKYLEKQKRIEILVKIFSFLLLPLVILIKPINAQAKYNGTPVMPQQVTMQNYADFGFSRTEGYEKVGYYMTRSTMISIMIFTTGIF